jgi:hypothetical protein
MVSIRSYSAQTLRLCHRKTGNCMRPGKRANEACKFRSSSVYGSSQHIHPLVENRTVLTTTINKNGRFHQLMMTPPLRACFESVYLQRQVDRAEGSGALPSWVFCSEQGTPIDGHNLRARWWTPLLAGAGLPTIRLHDLCVGRSFPCF